MKFFGSNPSKYENTWGKKEVSPIMWDHFFFEDTNSKVVLKLQQ